MSTLTTGYRLLATAVTSVYLKHYTSNYSVLTCVTHRPTTATRIQKNLACFLPSRRNFTQELHTTTMRMSALRFRILTSNVLKIHST